MEMLLAALLAILFRANLPIAILLVWISNPLTWLVIYTPPYLLGLFLLGETGISLHDITMDMMMDQFVALWIGCLIFGTALGIAGYVLANVIWRMMVVNQWSQRRHQRSNGTPARTGETAVNTVALRDREEPTAGEVQEANEDISTPPNHETTPAPSGTTAIG
jgi:uncharacterized protein (DUF2062 family)